MWWGHALIALYAQMGVNRRRNEMTDKRILVNDFSKFAWENSGADHYSSLPEPEDLKKSLLIDFSHGNFDFELLCSACTVRTLSCAETGKTIDWIHCKGIPRAQVQAAAPNPTTTMLFPCDYVTRACPGPPFSIGEKKATVDIAVFAPSKNYPEHKLPQFEIHRALTTCRGLVVADPPSGRMYKDFVGTISKEFEAALDEIKAIHNFDFGPEFEVAICKTLRRVLPQKFGVCRGFVVNARGDAQGDDIVIFDRMRFPTIRGIDYADYSRKEQVPIEAVYASIEAKHTLNIEGDDGSSLAKAVRQVSWAKLLCVQRRDVPHANVGHNITIVENNITIGENVAAESPPGWPSLRNPIYGAIFARQVRSKPGGQLLEDAASIEKALLDASIRCEIPPDLIVAGRNTLLIPALPTERNGESHTPSPFFLHGQSHMNPVTVDGIAFGAGLAFLLWALDWIELGDMPWPQILRNAMPPNPPQANKS